MSGEGKIAEAGNFIGPIGDSPVDLGGVVRRFSEHGGGYVGKDRVRLATQFFVISTFELLELKVVFGSAQPVANPGGGPLNVVVGELGKEFRRHLVVRELDAGDFKMGFRQELVSQGLFEVCSFEYRFRFL